MTVAIKINANDGKTRNVMTGGETTVDFDFPIFAATHLEVFETDTDGNITQLVKDADYSVPPSSVGQQAGGAINLLAGVYPTGATAGHVFTINQAAPYARTTDFNQAGDFFADTLNRELDLITQQIQQIIRDQFRSPLAPVDTTLTSFTLPSPVDGALLSWDGVDGTLQNTLLSSLPSSIDTLLTSLASGEYLRYNGTNWVNVNVSQISTDLSLGTIATQDADDVAITGGSIDGSALDAGSVTIDKLNSTQQMAFALMPIGMPFPVLDNITGVTAPSNAGDERFIKLTASDAYNTGLLTSESVTGTAPLVVATAVIDHATSPIDGQTVHLLNSENRYLMAGTSSGTVGNDQMQQITGNWRSNTVRANGLSAGGAFADTFSSAGSGGAGGSSAMVNVEFDSADSPNARTGNHTNVKHVQATFYMRIA